MKDMVDSSYKEDDDKPVSAEWSLHPSHVADIAIDPHMQWLQGRPITTPRQISLCGRERCHCGHLPSYILPLWSHC